MLLASLRYSSLALALVVLASQPARAQQPPPEPDQPVEQPAEPVEQPAEQPVEQPPPVMAQPAPAPPPAYPPPPYGPPPYGPPPGYYPPGYYPEPPREIDYEEGQPIPPGYRPEERIRKGLVIAGACVFGGVYLLNVIMVSTTAPDAVEEGSGPEWLYVPLVGPFIAISAIEDLPAGIGVLLGIDGLAQMGGVAMFIAGLAAKKKVLVRDYSYGGVQVTPLVGPGSLGAELRF